MRSALLRRSVPPASIDIMLASLSNNSWKQYAGALKKWQVFCNDNNVSFFEASIPSVILFLTKAFYSGCQYGTLNCYRSALSLILGPRISNDDRVTRFFKGIARLRPPLPKYSVTWNPSIVLNYLSNHYPNEGLKLEELTKKCVTLLALATAHRVQTLAKINIVNIEHFPSQLVIKIPDSIKTSRPGSKQPTLILPFFTSKPEICPSKTLIAYLDRTKHLRKNSNSLFISYQKPHNTVTSQSLSRWIKSVLKLSGIDTSIFTAHSTRHAATSKALKCGVTVDQIRKTASWSDSSSTFGKYYNRVIVQDNDGALAKAVFIDSD